MKTIPDDTLQLIIDGVTHKVYRDEKLEKAIETIYENNPYKIISLYRYTRTAQAASQDNKEYSKELGLTILNKIKSDEKIMLSILKNLPEISNICVEEFEIIINETFNNLPDQKEKLIKFMGGYGGKAKIAKSNLSKQIKLELTSYLVANKLIN